MPAFISSVKVGLVIVEKNKNSNDDDDTGFDYKRQQKMHWCSRQLREYLASRIQLELNEIVRVLQLTTCDNQQMQQDQMPEWWLDELAIIQQRLVKNYHFFY